MKNMTGHPLLYRRGATYYLRTAIPVDINSTYPKTEETFSLRTADYQEAVRKVRIAAAEVDRKFDRFCSKLVAQNIPILTELFDQQIKRTGEI